MSIHKLLQTLRRMLGTRHLRFGLSRLEPGMEKTTAASIESFISSASSIGSTGIRSSSKDIAEFKRSFPSLLPDWYEEVLTSFPIGDLCFTTKVDGIDRAIAGHFRDAATLLAEVSGAEPDLELAHHGYLVIGAAGNGDGWVIKQGSSIFDPVSFLCFSSYGPGNPENSAGCLVQCASSFASFVDKLSPSNSW
jgi:hypothetical protein